MSASIMTRRRLIGLFGVGAGGVLLAACGQAATSTAVPKAAEKPTAAPTGATAPAAGTATPAAKPGAVSRTTGVVTGPFEGEAKALTGAGATFPAALYSKWFEEYFKLTGVKVNYQSIGSGGGIKSISDQTVDFGATDGPMT